MALYAEGASSLCVNGSVDMLGRLAGISASKYTGYPPMMMHLRRVNLTGMDLRETLQSVLE